MRILKTGDELRAALWPVRVSEEKIGFVPTMGCFHGGHLRLLREAKQENDISVASIFVNPAQFCPGEDYESYPRTPGMDGELAEEEGVDYLFLPSPGEMYPAGYRTYVEVEELGLRLCGRIRPGHFRGVATVVAKLLNIVLPDVLYLGRKDFQQAVIVRRMVRDLDFKTDVCIIPTFREGDGLAMSSRNSYLTPAERKQAPLLFKALSDAKKAAEGGERNGAALTKMVIESLSSAGGMEPEYAEVVSPELEPLLRVEGPAVLSAAARLGKTRLIDNVLINCEEL